METSAARIPPTRTGWLLVATLAFWGIGALGGGVGLAADPDGGLGMGTANLEGTPFPDYLLPGLILVGLGLAAVVAAVGLARGIRRRAMSSRLAWWILLVALGINAWIFGEILFLWSTVQDLPAADQRFFYGFWAVYVPLSLAIAALALRVTRGTLRHP